VVSETNDTFAIPRSAVVDGENVITVLQVTIFIWK
jgi:hypothetical protein